MLRRSDREMLTPRGSLSGLGRGSAGISMEMARDGLEGVGTGYNT